MSKHELGSSTASKKHSRRALAPNRTIFLVFHWPGLLPRTGEQFRFEEYPQAIRGLLRSNFSWRAQNACLHPGTVVAKNAGKEAGTGPG